MSTPFVIQSLRGGINNSFPAIAVADDQCIDATNVEFVESMLGERRRGTSAITLPSSLSGKDRITFIYRHIPATDDTAAELWALGVTGTSSSQLARKTTSWSDVTVSDAATLTGESQYRWAAQSLHGKLFIAYNSSVDRLHVADTGATTLRRTGLAEPAAPTGANDGGVGTFSGTRYYRVRYTVQASSVTVRRSEPSDDLTFSPNGNDTGITVTKPATISESETHWELEASIDNANFYRIATTLVATTTVTDTQDYADGYAEIGTLSEDIGNYVVLPSGRYLCADEDRLLIGGSWESDSYAARVIWTPVTRAFGVGNDERQEDDTDPLVDLDGLEGGGITGMTQASAGTVWVFKTRGIYKLVRSGLRTRAYDTVCYTKERGALHGSVLTGVDQQGRPCVYFLDPSVGPCRIGAEGLEQCGSDIRTTWLTINLEATKVVCTGVYFPLYRQVIYCIATGSSDTPDLGLVLHTQEMRSGEDGAHNGWVLWNGTRAKALAMCMFANNIETGAARNRIIKPFIGVEGLGLLHQCDTGYTDNSVAYAARILTKPYNLKNLTQQFGIHYAGLLATATASSAIDMTIVRDFGLEDIITVSAISLVAEGSETQVIKKIDDFSGAEMRVAQFEFADVTSPLARFELNQLVLIGTLGHEG